jgi:sporulation protein YlmC with PRC-barrel domain
VTRRLRITDLLGAVVVDENGRRLGHVHDVVAARADNGAVVTGFDVGSGGIRARLGVPVGRRPVRVRWEDVRTVSLERIIVAAGVGARAE